MVQKKRETGKRVAGGRIGIKRIRKSRIIQSQRFTHDPPIDLPGRPAFSALTQWKREPGRQVRTLLNNMVTPQPVPIYV
jgi:hypothetical protein